MGRALIAVATVLGICFVIFGGVVYVTRDEKGIAVDAILSENITRSVGESGRRGGRLDLRELTDFDWDQVLIFGPGTPRKAISAHLGFHFYGELPYTAETQEVFVFTNRGRFVRFADYRGNGRFVGLTRPFQELDANDAVWDVRGLVATLRPRA